MREASALGLVLKDDDDALLKVNLPRLIQNWGRFIMQQLHTVRALSEVISYTILNERAMVGVFLGISRG